MDMTIRAASPGERRYTFKQSTHIGEHCGAVGRLRGDMGEDGVEFHTDWENCCGYLRTSEFLVDLHGVLDTLRHDERYGSVLQDRDTLTAYCEAHPESGMSRRDREYAFRLDTEQYTYFMRLCLDDLELDFELFPYRRDLFDLHMEQAEKGIHFIGPDGRDRFTIPDGDSIRIFTGSDNIRDCVARYVDEHHVELSIDYNVRRQIERERNSTIKSEGMGGDNSRNKKAAQWGRKRGKMGGKRKSKRGGAEEGTQEQSHGSLQSVGKSRGRFVGKWGLSTPI